MRIGYIESVIMDGSLDAQTITRCCRIPEDEYRREIDTAISSILHLSRERRGVSKIGLCGDHENCDDICRIQLTAKLDERGRALIFEWIDLDGRERPRCLEMRFMDIENGLTPYREYLEEIQSSPMSEQKALFSDQFRHVHHDRMMEAIGLSANDLCHHTKLIVQYGMTKYLTDLVAAIFPQGPYSSWQLVPAKPTQGGAAEVPGFEP